MKEDKNPRIADGLGNKLVVAVPPDWDLVLIQDTGICMYPKGYLIGVTFCTFWGNFQIARLGVTFGVPFGVTLFYPGIGSLLPIPGSTNR